MVAEIFSAPIRQTESTIRFDCSGEGVSTETSRIRVPLRVLQPPVEPFHGGRPTAQLVSEDDRRLRAEPCRRLPQLREGRLGLGGVVTEETVMEMRRHTEEPRSRSAGLLQHRKHLLPGPWAVVGMIEHMDMNIRKNCHVRVQSLLSFNS